MEKLSSILKIDLHIHSNNSSYKDTSIDFGKSNINNVEILLKKLQSLDINMFSITDHNRFDYDMYIKFKNLINKEPYDKVKCILPGIEFDVQLEEGKEACHIICIFDDKNEEKLKGISTVLTLNGELKNKNDFYTKEIFEKILHDINLNVVLIAHQHKHFDTMEGGRRSFSNSVSDPYEFIKTGYINALEYQKPNVQGMIIDSLKSINENIATIIGSDCHQWQFYPLHDEKSSPKNYISKIKCLPTFKGLAFTITSPETRFNRTSNDMHNYVDYISINNNEIKLCNGINAIIGDNGSGKSLLLELINENKLQKFYKDIVDDNSIRVNKVGSPKIEYIFQGKIIADVKKGTLFDNQNRSYYKIINNKKTFKKQILKYKDNLIKYIKNKIEIKEKINGLADIKIEIRNKNYNFFRPVVNINISVNEDNIHSERLSEFEEIYNSLETEIENYSEYYDIYQNQLKTAIKNLKLILDDIKAKNDKFETITNFKSVIIRNMTIFNSELDTNRTDEEKDELEYNKTISAFRESIVECIKAEKKQIKAPIFPVSLPGFSKNLYKGFTFTKTADYNGLYLEDAFFDELFVSGFSKDVVLDIDSEENFVNSLNGIKRIEDIGIWDKKVEKFIEKYSQEKTYIERSSTKENMGNTPGEVSIVFYEFCLFNYNNKISVFLIDQPEDDISSKKISKQLIDYFNNIRDKKQIIISTHNPMLVVNLDVDNVVYLNKDRNNVITTKNGCLEYDCNEYEIIKEIADNLDGGVDAIERRFKLYGN
ncbi:MAG: hypothetical protein PHG18_03785 [Bacilli bacterium]|nr:hypothetical protein [Bacilli bacterium]